MKFLNKIFGFLKKVWASDVVVEAREEIKRKIVADANEIAKLAIAEAIAGNLDNGKDRQAQAFDRIKKHLESKGKSYKTWAINWLIEEIYSSHYAEVK